MLDAGLVVFAPWFGWPTVVPEDGESDGLSVGVGVLVAVPVGVGVLVAVPVGVGVLVGVPVGVGVLVAVPVGVGVLVGLAEAWPTGWPPGSRWAPGSRR